MGLLAAAPSSAQEIVELPPEDRWLENRFRRCIGSGPWKPQTTGSDLVRFAEWASTGTALYVLDNMAKRIFVVGPSGKLQRMARVASFALAVMRDGRVVIADMGDLAYHIFGTDGDCGWHPSRAS